MVIRPYTPSYSSFYMSPSSSEKLWNKEYVKVMAANFSLFFAFYILTPLLPIYLSEHFGATKDVIGLVLSGYAVAALLFRPFSGYIVDSFDRKKVLERYRRNYRKAFQRYASEKLVRRLSIRQKIEPLADAAFRAQRCLFPAGTADI